jgi:hypothetical protein
MYISKKIIRVIFDQVVSLNRLVYRALIYDKLAVPKGLKFFFKKTLVKTDCCQNICIFNRVSTTSYGEIL